MRVLIVGCGYVGQAVGAALAQRGDQVWGLRRSADSSAALQGLGIRPVMGDITRPQSILVLPAAYDWVVHCVSSSSGGPEDYRRVYFEGTQNLLDWLRPSPPRKLVYTSSTSVYGQTEGEWVDESSPTEPDTETGKILLETEQLVLGAGGVVLRVAGIYGPGRGYWVKQFLAGEVRLDGTGERFLNMIHRDDLAGGIIAALERGKPRQIYNAVDDEPVSQRAFLEWLANELNRPVPPAQTSSTARKRGATNKRVSNRRLREELGYTFRYPTFREGVKERLKAEG